ncbi:hypothetical protein [Sorangium atrum]|uniref:Secreted protein n=1 Tax=Sorangium atrum TaxID=2995308 RepID=A0ABT5C011_9BACT|nr:hypothetical protein [Sorangium aterium]MDC0679692.1 hypothetical protein [Sorangium aterium]
MLATLAQLAAEIALVLLALVVDAREQRIAAEGVPDPEVAAVTPAARNWHPLPVEQPRYAATAVRLPTQVCPMQRRS